ncbi:MAG: hypothetical protein JWR86_3563 [Enterovirga sp.]|nr:hypothetical protein [Enterovirga sp.]
MAAAGNICLILLNSWAAHKCSLVQGQEALLCPWQAGPLELLDGIVTQPWSHWPLSFGCRGPGVREISVTAYIELVPPEDATGPLKELYDDLERVRGAGRVSNLFKGYGAFPELAKANFRRLNVLLGQGKLSVKLKEAILTALAEINHCEYCVSFHATAMLSAGASDEEVKAALKFDPDKLQLSEKERALFDYAMKANGDPHSITPADIEALKALGATDWDLVETLETVNTGNGFNTFAGALNIGTDSFLSYMAPGSPERQELA